MKTTYLSLAPPTSVSSQSALDVFKGRWAYKIPVEGCVSGDRLTFYNEPPGITLLKSQFTDYKDFLVLELGAHEGEQTYHLDRLSRAVYSIEGRPANFLKCLIVKNELNMVRTHFAVGDFHIYLDSGKAIWDLCYCVGVLYHAPNPVELLRLISKKCKRLILATVIYDEQGLHAADQRTKNHRFPTNWLNNIDPVPTDYDFNHYIFKYWTRHFGVNEGQVIMGQGASHSLVANLLEEDDLRRAITAVGGTILSFERADDERSPHVLAAITFDN